MRTAAGKIEIDCRRKTVNMRKEARITSGKDYKDVYLNGKSAANKYLVVYFLKKRERGLRLGISISRKVGSAVIRNRIKRLLREAFRHNEAEIKQGYDIVFIVRQPIKGKSFHEVEKAFIDILLRVGLIEKRDETTSDSID